MRRLFGVLAVIVGAVSLASCFVTPYEIWSLSSGEKLPFETGKMLCIEYDKEGKVVFRPTLHFSTFLSNKHLQYVIIKGDYTVEIATFHKVRGDLYIAAEAAERIPGEAVAFVRATENSIVRYDNDEAVVKRLAKKYGLSVNEYGFIKGRTQSDHKQFIMEASRNLAHAPIAMECHTEPQPATEGQEENKG